MHKHINKTLMVVLLGALSSGAVANNATKPLNVSGEYLGQKPPGLTPKVFAPEMVSTKGWEYGVVFAPTLNEMYFVREVNAQTKPEQQFVVFEQKENDWHERVISARVGTPTLSPDNKTLFFGRSYKTRTDKGWSEMKRLGEDFEPYRIMRVTSSFNGTVAFDEATKEGKSLLRYATMKNGKWQTPKPFPKQINTGKWNAHPFIAPDESYVIWDGQRGSETRNADLYISFKESNGQWGKAIKFGDNINTGVSEFAAQVSPDGKYLFFNRSIDKDNVDTFWVDAKVIEQLKPAHIKKYLAKQAPKASAAQAVGSFRDIPGLEQAFIDTAPQSADNMLLAGALSLPKEKQAAIVQLAKEIGEGKHGRYDSMLITHKDKLVFESYHQRGRYGLAHPQASAVKGYTSLVLGRAIELGYLSMADLNRPLIDLLDEVDKSKLVKGAEKITLHKALTMHGGLSLDEETWKTLEQSPEQLKGQGLVQTLLEHSGVINEESQVYKYGNYNSMLVMTAIDAVTPNGARAFIEDEVLSKLNITNYHWDTHISGLPQGGWMVDFTSRDMLKLGNIVANKGKWQGEQFISAEYLKKATSGLVKPNIDWMPDQYRYGYFWYHMPVEIKGKVYDATLAWGGGGQRVVVVEALDLVIAITGHDRDDQIMTQLTQVVIPAFAS